MRPYNQSQSMSSRISIVSMGAVSFLVVSLSATTPSVMGLLHVSPSPHLSWPVHHHRPRFLSRQAAFLDNPSFVVRRVNREHSLRQGRQCQLFSFSTNNNGDDDGMNGQEDEWTFPRQNPWDRSTQRPPADESFQKIQQEGGFQQQEQPPPFGSSQLPYGPPNPMYATQARQQPQEMLGGRDPQQQQLPPNPQEEIFMDRPTTPEAPLRLANPRREDIAVTTKTTKIPIDPCPPDRALAVISELKANAALFGAFAYGGLALPSALTVTESKVTSVTTSLSTTRPIPANILLETFVVLDIATLCLMIGCVAAAQWLIYRLTDGSWFLIGYAENNGVDSVTIESDYSTTTPLASRGETVADEETQIFDVVEVVNETPSPSKEEHATAMAEWRVQSSAMGRLVTSPEYSTLFFFARTTFDLGLITLLLAVGVRAIATFDSTISLPVVALLGGTSLLLAIAFVQMQWTVFAPLERQQQLMQMKRTKGEGIEPIMSSVLSQIGTWIPFGVIAASVVLAIGGSYVFTDGTPAISTTVPLSGGQLLEQVNVKLDAYSKEAGQAKLKTVLEKVNEEKERKPSPKPESAKEKNSKDKKDRPVKSTSSSTSSEKSGTNKATATGSASPPNKAVSTTPITDNPAANAASPSEASSVSPTTTSPSTSATSPQSATSSGAASPDAESTKAPAPPVTQQGSSPLQNSDSISAGAGSSNILDLKNSETIVPSTSTSAPAATAATEPAKAP